MPGISVDPPPLATAIVDPQTGLPTRAFVDFMHRMWTRSGGSDDNADFILKMLTGARFPHPKPVEATQTEQTITQLGYPSNAGQAEQSASSALALAMMAMRQDANPNDVALAKGARVPVGGIILWSGAIADIPDGWALCDGTEGTPDLQDSFVIGAGNTYSPDDTGGSDTITINTASSGVTAGSDFNALTSASADPELPPYYALAFIMKL